MESTTYQVLSSSLPDLPTHPQTLRQLFNIPIEPARPERLFIKSHQNDSLFLLWLISVDEKSAWTIDDAVIQGGRVFTGDIRAGSSNFLFRKEPASTNLAVISRFVGHSRDSFLHPLSEKEDLSLQNGSEENNTTWLDGLRGLFRRKYTMISNGASDGLATRPSKRLMYRYLIPTLMLLLVCISIFFAVPLKHHPWIRFSTVGSRGPRYQLQLKPENVSAWVSAQKHVDEDWFLRIDDGAIYPRTLLEEKELKYQEWYWRRYPEVNAIRLDGQYLTEDFLAHPNRTMPVDKYYHIAHCVASARRYWVAKETGHHICPMDLNWDHMNHCFEQILEPWAFPKGKRGEVSQEELAVPKFNIDWISRVCF